MRTRIVQDKPAPGAADLDAVTTARSGGRDGERARPPRTRWLLVAALIILVAGVGLAGWLGRSPGERGITAEPAQKPETLTGIRWLATQIGDEPVRPNDAGRVPFLIFETENQVTGDDGCNMLRGTYALDGARLSIDGLVSTKKACGEPDDMKQQSSYGEALSATAAMERDGPTLTLLDSAGTALLVFRAADEPSPDPSTSVLIRIRNDAAVNFDRVQETFPFGPEIDYGPLPADGTSEYEPVDRAYPYAFLRVQLADGRELVYQPIDYVGETLLPPGRYTYVLTIDGSGSDAGIDLRLEADQ